MLLSKRMKGLSPCIAGRWVRLVVLAVGFALSIQGLWAQGTADIVGTVTDNSGSVVPNAKVTVKNLGPNLARTRQTAASGQSPPTIITVCDFSVHFKIPTI